MQTRVMIADDHDLVRFGVKALLESAGFVVVGEAADGREALRMAQDLRPHVLVMDVTMPGLNGIDVAAQLRERAPEVRVVIVSMHSDAEHVHRALAAGASGYLLKGSGRAELADAVATVHSGRRYLGSGIEAPSVASARNADRSPLDSLSARERQVLALVVEGHSSARIAALVHLSPKSVDTYRSRLMKKLGVADVTALVKFAVQHGLTPPQ